MAELKHTITLDTDEAKKDMKDLGKTVDEVTKELRANEESARKALSEHARRAREAAAAERERAKQLKQVQAMMSATGSVGKFAVSMMSGITAAVKGFELAASAIEYNVKTAAQFEQTLHNLQAITQDSALSMDFFAAKAIDLGKTTTQTASQVAEAFKIIAQKSPQLIESGTALASVAEKSIILAQAGSIGVPEASGAVTNVLNQFGMMAADTGYIIDVLAKGSQVGAGSIGYLGEALVQVGAQAKISGATLEETVALLEMLAQGGMDAGQAGRQLRNILVFSETKQDLDEFKPSVVGVTQALKNIYDANWDTEKMKKVFGTENIPAINFLIQHITDLDNMLVKLQESEGTAEKQSATNVDTYLGSINLLKSAWEGLNLEINRSNGFLKEMIDNVTSILGGLSDLVKKFNESKVLREYSGKSAEEMTGLKVDSNPEDQAIIDQFNKEYSSVRAENEKERERKQKEIVDKYVKIMEARVDTANELLNRDKDELQAKIDQWKPLSENTKNPFNAWEMITNPFKGVAGLLMNDVHMVADLPVSGFEEELGRLKKGAASAAQALEYIKSQEPGNAPARIAKMDPNAVDSSSSATKNKITKNAGELFDEATAKFKQSVQNLENYEKDWKQLNIKDQKEIQQHEEEMVKKRLSIWQSYYNALRNLNYEEAKSLRGTFVDSVFQAEDQIDKLQAIIDQRTNDERAKQLAKTKLQNVAEQIKARNNTKRDNRWERTIQDAGYKPVAMTDVSWQFADQFNPLKNKQDNSALADMRSQVRNQIDVYETELERLQGLNVNDFAGLLWDDPEAVGYIDAVNERIKDLIQLLEQLHQSEGILTSVIPKDDVKETKNYYKNLGKVAGGVGQVANAFGQFGDKSKEMAVAIQVITTAATITQLIASLIKPMTSDPTVTTSIWGWIAGGLSATAALITMIANIKNAGSYAQGGIVKGAGNMTVGDQYWARVNGGEAVLTQRDQARFMKILDGAGYYGSGNGPGQLSGEVKIKGSDLYVALSNYSKLKPSGIKF